MSITPIERLLYTAKARTTEGRMEDNTLVQSSFSATINAPIEKVDIPSWSPAEQ
jgi:hypothetical protein